MSIAISILRWPTCSDMAQNCGIGRHTYAVISRGKAVDPMLRAWMFDGSVMDIGGSSLQRNEELSSPP